MVDRIVPCLGGMNIWVGRWVHRAITLTSLVIPLVVCVVTFNCVILIAIIASTYLDTYEYLDTNVSK